MLNLSSVWMPTTMTDDSFHFLNTISVNMILSFPNLCHLEKLCFFAPEKVFLNISTEGSIYRSYFWFQILVLLEF